MMITVQAAACLHDNFDWCDEDGYVWETLGGFIGAVVDELGWDAPIWRTAETRTEISADNVTEVIAEQCDDHGTGKLLIGTDNAGLVWLGTYASPDRCNAEAESLALAIDVPLITREGCSP